MAKRGKHVEVYQSAANGRWYFRVVAGNGKITEGSRGGAANGYSRRDAAVRAARTDFPTVPIDAAKRGRPNVVRVDG